MDRDRLETRLVERFDAVPRAARVVARQATDLDDAGRYERDFDAPLTVEIVVANLADAPDEWDLVERWNWWLGALELSHGGYSQFGVRHGGV
ncbi:hypothetical protein [Halorhabdus rudnickae]|uniref:hypothetical protein n=1 Tax=Halorhabdus rudnickae TaxID=1775544 RepID=UPI0010841A25|nr:hypothetical protein [Halorhabdus rudnickae]